MGNLQHYQLIHSNNSESYCVLYSTFLSVATLFSRSPRNLLQEINCDAQTHRPISWQLKMKKQIPYEPLPTSVGFIPSKTMDFRTERYLNLSIIIVLVICLLILQNKTFVNRNAIAVSARELFILTSQQKDVPCLLSMRVNRIKKGKIVVNFLLLALCQRHLSTQILMLGHLLPYNVISLPACSKL